MFSRENQLFKSFTKSAEIHAEDLDFILPEERHRNDEGIYKVPWSELKKVFNDFTVNAKQTIEDQLKLSVKNKPRQG